MFTYSDYLNFCWSDDTSCWVCSCLVDYEERPIYCSNNGQKFCYRHYMDIMLDYYLLTTGAVFVPSSFLDGLGVNL